MSDDEAEDTCQEQHATNKQSFVEPLLCPSSQSRLKQVIAKGIDQEQNMLPCATLPAGKKPTSWEMSIDDRPGLQGVWALSEEELRAARPTVHDSMHPSLIPNAAGIYMYLHTVGKWMWQRENQ